MTTGEVDALARELIDGIVEVRRWPRPMGHFRSKAVISIALEGQAAQDCIGDLVIEPGIDAKGE